MNNSSRSGVLIMLVAVAALLVAVLAWLSPFNPIGPSPLITLQAQDRDREPGENPESSSVITSASCTAFMRITRNYSSTFKGLDEPRGSRYWGGVQVKLIRDLDVPIGWTVHLHNQTLEGPTKLRAGDVMSLWAPDVCKPLDLTGLVNEKFMDIHSEGRHGRFAEGLEVNFDLQTVITAVLASLLSVGMITAGIVYVMQKAFDRALEVRVGKILEDHKQNVQEETRRKAAIFDQQFEYLTQALTVTYRIRNQIRSLIWSMDPKPQTRDSGLIEPMLEDLETYRKELREFLFVALAVVPEGIFRDTHTLSHNLVEVVSEVEKYLQELKKPHRNDAVFHDIRANLQQIYERVDATYVAITIRVQSFLGVRDKETS